MFISSPNLSLGAYRCSGSLCSWKSEYYPLHNAWSNVQTKIEQSEGLIRGADKFFKDLSGQKSPDFAVFGSGIQQDFPGSWDCPSPLKGSTMGKFTSVCSLSVWLDMAKLFPVCSILALSSSSHFLSNSMALLCLPKCRPLLDLTCLSVVCSIWVCLSWEGQPTLFGF